MYRLMNIALISLLLTTVSYGQVRVETTTKVETDTTKMDTTIVEMEKDSFMIEKSDTIEIDSIAFDTIKYQDEAEDLGLFETTVKGRVMTAMITPEGDTLIMETLDDISITSLRSFKSDADYRKYMKFKRYAAKVYPYAREAIKIFREMEYATQTMEKKEKKKYIKQLEEDLKVEFEEPLKKLTKLQGKILIKMIERELDRSMYDLLKELKGRFRAYTWHSFSKLYSYDLKEGYQYGKYEILDAVLQDFNISYRIEQEENNQ